MKMRGFASLAPEVIVISGVSLWVTAAFGGHGVNPHQLIALLVPAAYVWILTSRLWLPVVRGRKLLERGLVAKGTIVGKRFARRGNWGGDQLWYEFQPNGGTPVRGTVQPLSNNILKLRVGESVTVLYYANDPATSTIYPLALWEVDA
jgi:hypothetical protein